MLFRISLLVFFWIFSSFVFAYIENMEQAEEYREKKLNNRKNMLSVMYDMESKTYLKNKYGIEEE